MGVVVVVRAVGEVVRSGRIMVRKSGAMVRSRTGISLMRTVGVTILITGGLG